MARASKGEGHKMEETVRALGFTLDKLWDLMDSTAAV